MKDADLREFERASQTSPTDAVLLERLEYARVRAGRGWNGERLLYNDRGNMAAEGERGVYRWLVAPLAALEVSLVYVPGGVVSCPECQGRGGGVDPRRVEIGLRGTFLCAGCEGTGRVRVAAFYVGRFPVTWFQYNAFCSDPRRAQTNPWAAPPGFPTDDHHPVVNVTRADALAFCTWAGLRLPTAREWRWAALGAPSECGECFGGGIVPRDGGGGISCRPCSGSGRSERRFPWGDARPTPERCAAADPRYASKHTAPVVVKECALCDARDPHVTHEPGFYPARPAGRSWCGAHDVVGNVEQWCAGGGVLGFSYSSSSNSTWALPRRHDDGPVDIGDSFSDVGFRVALDAA